MKLFLSIAVGIYAWASIADVRIWTGGDIRQNDQALASISNANEIPRGALLFVIACLTGSLS